MRQFLIGACLVTSALAFAISAAAADSQFVRELDAYCVSDDGTRKGVAASQDGATNSYVQLASETLEIIRGSHNRRAVSLWHAALDAAGFDAMEGQKLDAPYCAIERVQAGQVHAVQWREGEAPDALAEIFTIILGSQLNAQGAGK